MTWWDWFLSCDGNDFDIWDDYKVDDDDDDDESDFNSEEDFCG